MRPVRGRLILIIGTLLLSVLFFLPSTPLYRHLPAWWGNYFPDKGIVLGLDLQGGMHLVLQVKGEEAVEGALDRGVSALKGSLDEKKLATASLFREGKLIRLIFAPEEAAPNAAPVPSPESSPPPKTTPKGKEAIIALIKEEYPDWEIADSDGGITLAYSDEVAKRIRDNATSQVLETIRNRIDQFGVTEPLIQQQGKSEILVQLPGVTEPQRAMELIGRTALLEFRLLDETHPLASQLPPRVEIGKEAEAIKPFAGLIPADDEILFERITDDATEKVTHKRPYLVKKTAALTGATLTDARVSIGDFNTPYVSIVFDAIGAKQFEAVTAANVQRQLAIVLDGTVYSAPTIQERIPGGRAQVSGTYTTEEANDLAIILRAGSLPAPVEIIQNVTVGPSLGRDSIDMGIRAGVIGTLLIVLFMVIYYRASGLLADFAMGLNIVLLIGALAALNATLTLPGIAGIILTIGMAVDSNVLIFERIRDELRTGKPVRLSIDAGYDKAFSSIFDSHVTALITSVVLFIFGTGPIKGFAVSLSLGIVINLFTSLVGTRVVFDWLIQQRKLTRLSV